MRRRKKLGYRRQVEKSRIERKPTTMPRFAKYFGSSTPGSTRHSATLRGTSSLPFQNQNIETGLFKIALLQHCLHVSLSPSHHRLFISSSGRRLGSTSLRPGGSATTLSDLTGAEAKSGLALPHAAPPNAVYTITPKPGTLIRVNPVAEDLFNQPGGLPEIQFPMGTEPGTVSAPTLIR